jgi:hypothetical protein
MFSHFIGRDLSWSPLHCKERANFRPDKKKTGQAKAALFSSSESEDTEHFVVAEVATARTFWTFRIKNRAGYRNHGERV